MRTRSRQFRGQVISIRRYLFSPLILLLLLSYLFSLAVASGLSLPHIPSNWLLSGIGHAVLATELTEEHTYRHSAYDLLADTLLSIRASDVMSKKYAALYGGIKKKSDSKNQEDVLLGEILETDVSAEGITFINTPGYAVDANALLNTKLNFSSPFNGPRVLIVHTHTSEAYAENSGGRSENAAQNVVSVGAEIAKSLEKAGIRVIHDTTQNDNPSYNQSYKKAMTVINQNLSEHPTIEVVLDIHRDYIKRDDGTMVKPTVKTKSGEKAAQIMFVIGTDNMGLLHPNWRHNLAFAVQIQNKLNELQPNLCRSVNIRTERFNQHATKGSMIIEVGTAVNTLDEAKLSGKLTGEAIAKVLLEYQ